MAVASPSRRRPSLPEGAGDRRVWLAAGISGAIVAIVLLTYLAWPRDYLTGTNNTVSRIIAGAATDGQRYCVNGQTLPKGTGVIQLTAGTQDARPPRSV